MTNPRGAFALELVPEGWFDETIRPEGWFSQDFLEPDVSGSISGSLLGSVSVAALFAGSHGVKGTLASTIQPSGVASGRHGVSGSAVGSVSVQASLIALHGVSGPELGVVTPTASLTGAHGVSGSFLSVVPVTGSFTGEHGVVADTGGPGGFRKKVRKATIAKPARLKTASVSTRAGLQQVEQPPQEAVTEPEKPALPPIIGVMQGNVGLIASLKGLYDLPKSQIERYLESYGVQDFRAVAKRILAALKARSANETPKAIIRDVLSQAGIADRQLQLLTSLIFVAWSARRTIHLEAA